MYKEFCDIRVYYLEESCLNEFLKLIVVVVVL